jgi:hypothetical protein
VDRRARSSSISKICRSSSRLSARCRRGCSQR